MIPILSLSKQGQFVNRLTTRIIDSTYEHNPFRKVSPRLNLETYNEDNQLKKLKNKNQE